jgi:hypothetical protein
MTTADDSLAITAMEAVNGATTANDDPGAITSGAVDETATAGIDVPAVNTSGTATDVMVATDASPAIIAMESMNGAATANDDPGAIFTGAVHETATAGIDVPAINTSGTANISINHIYLSQLRIISMYLSHHITSIISTYYVCLFKSSVSIISKHAVIIYTAT